MIMYLTRSYLSTLRYNSVVDKRESSQDFQNKWSKILENIKKSNSSVHLELKDLGEEGRGSRKETM